MARHVGVDRQVAGDDVVEAMCPALHVGIEHAGRFALAGVDFRIEQIAHQHDALLRNEDGDIAGAVADAFLGQDEGEAAELERHAALEAEVGAYQFADLVDLVGLLALGELLALLHVEVAHLRLGGDEDRLVLAVLPGARGMIAGGVRGDEILHLLVGQLADLRQHLVGGAKVGVEHDDAVGRDDEARVARTAVVLHHVDTVGDGA